MKKLLIMFLVIINIVSFSVKLVSIYPEVSENLVKVVASFDEKINNVETDWNLSKTVFNVFIPNVDVTSSMFFIPVSVGPVEAIRVINVGRGIMITTHLLIPKKGFFNILGNKLIIEFPRSKERINVAFTQDMTFESMVKYLAERLNLNVIVSGDLGRLNLKLNNVTPEDALRDLFFAIGDVAYSYFPDGTMYIGKFDEVSKRFGKFWGIYKAADTNLAERMKKVLSPEAMIEYIPKKSVLFVYGTSEEHELIASLISVSPPLERLEYNFSPASSDEIESLLKTLKEVYEFNYYVLESIDKVILEGSKETINKVKKYLDTLKHRKTEEIKKEMEQKIEERAEQEEKKEEKEEVKKERYYLTVSNPQLAAELLKVLYGIDVFPIPQRNIVVVETELKLKKDIEETLKDLSLLPSSVLEIDVLKDEVQLVKEFLSGFFGISSDRVQVIDVNEKFSKIVLRLQKDLVKSVKEALKIFLKMRRTERKKEIVFLEKELDPKIVSAMNLLFNVNTKILGKVLIIEGFKEDVEKAKNFIEEITKEVVYYDYVEITVNDDMFSELKKLVEMETKVILTDNLKNLGMILMKSEKKDELNKAKTVITSVLKRFEEIKKKGEKEIFIRFVPKIEGFTGEDVKKILSLMHNISVEITEVGYVLMGEKNSIDESIKTLNYLSSLIKREKVDFIKIIPELRIENISSILQNIFKLKTFVSDGLLVIYGEERNVEKAKSFYEELQKLIPEPVIKEKVVRMLDIPVDFPMEDFKNMINLAVPEVKVVGIPGFNLIIVKGYKEEIDKVKKLFDITLNKFKELIEEKKKLEEEKEKIRKYVKLTFSVPKKFPFDNFDTFIKIMIPEAKSIYLESIDLVLVEIPEDFEKDAREYFDFFLKKFFQKVEEEEKQKEKPIVTKKKILEIPPIIPTDEFANLSKLFAPSSEITIFPKLGYLVVIGREEDIETVEELLKLCVNKFKKIEEEKKEIIEKEEEPPEKPEYVKVVNGKINITAENVNLGELIKEISNKLNISIVFVNIPTESVSMKISNITWEDFKRIVSKNYGYVFEKDPSGIITIKKIEMKAETRYIYKIPHNFDKVKSLIEFYGGTVYVDNVNNLMIVTGITDEVKKELDNLIEYVSKPTKQVKIKVKVVDKTLIDEDAGALGENITINVPGYGTVNFSDLGSSIDFNIGILDIANYEKLLEAMTNLVIQGTMYMNKVVSLDEILASPEIVTVSGTEARIFIGDKIPYVVKTSEGPQVMFLEPGIELKITPYVRSDGTVELSIYTKVSNPANFVEGVPGEKTREAQTNVIVKDGDTVVIGGLMREVKRVNETKLPFLSDIPIIGELFKRKSEGKEKRNLLIFITVKVVKF